MPISPCHPALQRVKVIHFRLPPPPHGSPRRTHQHTAISLGLQQQTDPHPFIISVFPARSFHTGHAPILPWRKDRKVRPGLRNSCRLLSKEQSTNHVFVTVSESKSWCPVRPDDTSQGGEERFSAGPCKRQVARTLKPQTPRKLSAKAFPRKGEGEAMTNFLASILCS